MLLLKALKVSLLSGLLWMCTSGVAHSQTVNNNETGTNDSASSRDLRAGFGRPESIAGMISGVDDRGVLTLTRVGAGQPATTNLTVTETRTSLGDNPKTTEVEATPGPGQADYSFRITATTKIVVNGESRSLADLANLRSQRATVHFVPRRSGNFATLVEVNR